MSCDFFALANTGVQGLHPYQAGKPTDELERELGLTDIVKLASNENPLGVGELVKEALAQELSGITRYPDANGFYLKQALAKKYDLAPAQFTLGNGSNDVLELIARSFVTPEHEVIFAQHAFVVYPLVTQAIGATGVAVPAKDWGHDLPAMLAAITPRTRLIFIANPNNPTGTFLTAEALYSFLTQVPEDVIVVLDEAYFEYVDKELQAPSITWLNKFSNLIITRTFSKAYGLAGLRVGYSMSHPDIADILNRVRQPFNCNSFALAGAKAALADHDFLTASVALNNQQRDVLETFFDEQGIGYIPSKGNFITIELVQDPAVVYQKLLHKGVIVRPVAGYGLTKHLRVSIGTENENAVFMEALISVLGE
ncbi:histidinol-phosphate transaminase [Moritella sp. 24]|uniref:histidinol-phosphate transaminase n=1 Tax=Moritella sp. 24 TaxID=2746230 RepID=UPI001BA9280C|nr:histidinol-phosphate transaminase [Moritella sp. 24]QUM76904.1 histidinol-phosphate transaminase [Moritella sp. 24]